MEQEKLNTEQASPSLLGVSWRDCNHKFEPYFGPVIKCKYCGATSMYSMDGKPKTISAPLVFADE